MAELRVTGDVLTAEAIDLDPTSQLEDGVRDEALGSLILALRSEAHEYANRIHALSGLLALDMPDAAEGLLADFALEHNVCGAALVDAIGSPALAGLLVAKRAIGRRRGVSFEIDQESSLAELPMALTDIDAISILGNFIDNAFDAVASLPEDRRVVEVGIYEDEDHVRFRVADRGAGLDTRVRAHAFEAGCTSKPGHPGLGLAIVEGVLTRANGHLDIDQGPWGTVFRVTFPLH